jgi:hypothetical protein
MDAITSGDKHRAYAPEFLPSSVRLEKGDKAADLILISTPTANSFHGTPFSTFVTCIVYTSAFSKVQTIYQRLQPLYVHTLLPFAQYTVCTLQTEQLTKYCIILHFLKTPGNPCLFPSFFAFRFSFHLQALDIGFK